MSVVKNMATSIVNMNSREAAYEIRRVDDVDVLSQILKMEEAKDDPRVTITRAVEMRRDLLSEPESELEELEELESEEQDRQDGTPAESPQSSQAATPTHVEDAAAAFIQALVKHDTALVASILPIIRDSGANNDAAMSEALVKSHKAAAPVRRRKPTERGPRGGASKLSLDRIRSAIKGARKEGGFVVLGEKEWERGAFPDSWCKYHPPWSINGPAAKAARELGYKAHVQTAEGERRILLEPIE